MAGILKSVHFPSFWCSFVINASPRSDTKLTDFSLHFTPTDPTRFRIFIWRILLDSYNILNRSLWDVSGLNKYYDSYSISIPVGSFDNRKLPQVQSPCSNLGLWLAQGCNSYIKMEVSQIFYLNILYKKHIQQNASTLYITWPKIWENPHLITGFGYFSNTDD